MVASKSVISSDYSLHFISYSLDTYHLKFSKQLLNYLFNFIFVQTCLSSKTEVRVPRSKVSREVYSFFLLFNFDSNKESNQCCHILPEKLAKVILVTFLYFFLSQLLKFVPKSLESVFLGADFSQQFLSWCFFPAWSRRLLPSRHGRPRHRR